MGENYVGKGSCLVESDMITCKVFQLIRKECTAGFEPAVLQICSLSLLTTQPCALLLRGTKGLNLQPSVLETGALPVELDPLESLSLSTEYEILCDLLLVL